VTWPSPRIDCSQGRKIEAAKSMTMSKSRARARPRAYQLDLTKCIAGKRSPSSLVGLKRIIRREGDDSRWLDSVWLDSAVGDSVSVAISDERL
jgi:hypothetical protein